MRRSSQHDKALQMMRKVQGQSKKSTDFNVQNFKLEMNKINQQTPMSSKTHRYNQLQKPAIKVSYRRPSTTQRSNSFSEIKSTKQVKLGQDLTIKKPHTSMSKNHKHTKDLWVSTMKDFPKQSNSNLSSKFHHISMNKGRIHRGISFKGDQKYFLKEFVFQTKNPRPNHISQRQSKSRDQQYSNRINPTSVIDLMGKNLKRSMAAKSLQKDDFFEYVMRFSYKTKKGYAPSNPGKINQDNYITNPNLNGKTWQHLFGICDGHGPLGHLVSSFIKSCLPLCISNIKNIQKNPSYNLKKGFQNAYEKLIKQSRIDMSFSGSTVIVCYFIQNKLFTCNVGDSRAIIGKKNHKEWLVLPLSVDHKPNISTQADRIKKNKGRVEAYKDDFGQEIGPLRVWLKNDNVPGLAMTRSFGDLVAASVGVSHQPQIKQFTLSQQDKIVLIASDGVFEFLGNEQIIKQLAPYYQKKQIQQASDHLLNLAHRSWTRNSSIVDDITFILIFLHYNEI